jgi:hypothetical protein
VNKIIETKKPRIVNAKTLIVAIDIGKTTDIGYCRCPSGKDDKPFEFTNNVEGFTKLWDRIGWMKRLITLRPGQPSSSASRWRRGTFP